MEKVNAPQSIATWRIVCASQSEPNWSEERYILIYAGDDPRTYCGEGYILLEGGHCSCYDWDEVDWSAVKYTAAELKKLGESKIDEHGCYYEAERAFWRSVLHAIGGE